MNINAQDIITKMKIDFSNEIADKNFKIAMLEVQVDELNKQIQDKNSEE